MPYFRHLPLRSTCFTSFCMLLWLLLPGCNSQEGNGSQAAQPSDDVPLQEEHQVKSNPAAADTMAFEAAFAYFFAALQAADTTRLQQFVHPQHGVWLIEQPGAVPKMTQVKHLNKFKRDYQERSFFTIKEEVKECKLLAEPFPAFDCAAMEGGKTGYSKDGCFAWKADKFRQSGYWDYASLTEEQIQLVKNALPLLRKSVLHTRSSFEFQFGYVDNTWRLLFVKLITPCSA